MSGSTAELNLKTAVDSDDTADYLTLSLASSLQTVDALFNNTTGHSHSGLHQGGPIGSIPAGAIADGSITSAKIADGTIQAVDIAAGVVGTSRIAEVVLGAAAATIDFTAIPATYRHLLVYLYARGDSGVVTNLQIRFNNDSAANYDYQRHQGQAAASVASESFAQTQIAAFSLVAASSPVNIFNCYSMWIPHYANTANQKVALLDAFHKEGITTGLMVTYHVGAAYRSTAAISRVTLFPGAGNFVAGTMASLYGAS